MSILLYTNIISLKANEKKACKDWPKKEGTFSTLKYNHSKGRTDGKDGGVKCDTSSKFGQKRAIFYQNRLK